MGLFEQEQSISHHKGGMSMRKFLTILLVCGLVLLCACGKQTQDADKPQDTLTGNYKAAVAAIDSGDYRTAYDLLLNATDEQFKELLTHFVFVPTSVASVIRSEDYEMHFSTVITYDKVGNPLTHVHTDKGDATETVYTYTDGRLTQEVATSDDYKRTITYAYDAAGRLTRKHITTNNEDATTYTYAYDEKGNLTEEKRVSVYSNGGEEATTTYRYNERDKVTLKKTTFKDGGWNEETTEYRADGTLYKVTERSSSADKVCVDEYDAQERLWKEWIYPTDEEPYVNREYTYDAAGHVIKDAHSTGADYYTYDEKGNLIEESNGVDRVVYTYDESGNCLSATRYNLNGTVKWQRTYTYDEGGNCLIDAIAYSSGQTESTANTYDGDGNRITQTYEGFSSETGEAITITENVSWTLFYYPDEVPEVVEEKLYSLTIPPNAA